MVDSSKIQNCESEIEQLELLHDKSCKKPVYVYRSEKTLLQTIYPITSSEEVSALLDASLQVPQPVKEALGGRATLIPFEDSSGNQFVLKSYRRGGFFRNLLPGGLFLGWGEKRSERELRALLSAKEIGVTVPGPIGNLVKGRLLKREWLVMRTLPPHRTLASLSLQDERQEIDVPIEKYLSEVVRQIELLIKEQILHVDLHPGNVVVGENGEVFLIDFDHAEHASLSSKQLRDRYIRRWRRAVIKHDLPEFLSEIFCSLLRRKIDQWDRASIDLKTEGSSS